MKILEVQHLTKRYAVEKGFFKKTRKSIQAVEDVSFDLKAGETVGLVGESGCGKTTLGRAILRLVEPSSGEIFFEKNDVTRMNSLELKAWRKNAQMIFQDPFGSLNPRMRVRDILAEPFIIHGLTRRDKIDENVTQLLQKVGLGPEAFKKYPHEFSGGQRQRIGIARALAVKPKLIVADEPVSALDVSIQAQIVNLLLDLQSEFGLSYIFISHDLRIVEFIAHRVLVMYLGRIVESLPAKGLTDQAKHPYTLALLSSVPTLDSENKKTRLVVKGDVPDPSAPPSGCVFHPRCPLAEERCTKEAPALRSLNEQHQVSCHLT